MYAPMTENKSISKKTIVCLLFGGRSDEHEVSLRSASAIYDNLDRDRFEVTCIYIDKKGNWKIVSSPHLSLEELAKDVSASFLPWEEKNFHETIKADIYFPVLHGPYGEDGTIQGLFEMADVPYVGAGVTASAIGMDKALMKTIFKARNLPVVRFITLLESEWNSDRETVLEQVKNELPLPLFVKPANLGSSVGITKVKEFSQIPEAIRTAFSFDRKILVEKGITGREFECSVLGNENPEASLPGEVIPFREFYDYRDKYIDGKTEFRIPARLTFQQIEKIQEISLEAFRAIDCSGMARVDFFLENDTGKLYLNEINTIPGFTEISMYPKLWEKSSLSFRQLVERLIQLGFERHESKKRSKGNIHQ